MREIEDIAARFKKVQKIRHGVFFEPFIFLFILI